MAALIYISANDDDDDDYDYDYDARPEGPKLEARRADRGEGVLGEGAVRQLGALGERCNT